jgi:hypothetical protein
MRLVKVKVPQGTGEAVREMAFASGIEQATSHTEELHRNDGSYSTKDVVEIETGTPLATTFVDAVMTASFFDPAECSITTREPRSVTCGEPLSEVTWPSPEPIVDVFQDAWQFSHLTAGLLGRLFIAGCLLSYGLIQDHLLLVIAGLLFAPFLPVLIGISFGLLTRQWKLVRQGLLTVIVGLVLVAVAGAFVALVAEMQPISFNAFEPMHVSVLLSSIIGVAAALANADDGGRRELIGLAAAAQVAILPAWFGISCVTGFPSEISPIHRALTLLLNLVTLVVASSITHYLLGYDGAPLRIFAQKTNRWKASKKHVHLSETKDL